MDERLSLDLVDLDLTAIEVISPPDIPTLDFMPSAAGMTEVGASILPSWCCSCCLCCCCCS